MPYIQFQVGILIIYVCCHTTFHLDLVASHGNSKQKVPFYPTLPSTKCLIQKEISSKQSGPKHTISIVSQKVDGVTCATSPCDLPHNERQISHLKSRGVEPQHLGVQDPMADQVSLSCSKPNLKITQESSFVIVALPQNLHYILSHDWQLGDLVRFCSVSGNFSILTGDPTFNLGNFDVTPTCISPSAIEDSLIWHIYCIHWFNIGALSQDLWNVFILCIFIDRPLT